jgi:hypothetical protein
MAAPSWFLQAEALPQHQEHFKNKYYGGCTNGLGFQQGSSAAVRGFAKPVFEHSLPDF